jgi:hypothetical protein
MILHRVAISRRNLVDKTMGLHTMWRIYLVGGILLPYQKLIFMQLLSWLAS